MRAAVVGCALVAFAGAGVAQPGGFTSDEGGFRIKFPGAPKVTEPTAKSAVGDLKVTVAIYATADGSAFMVSYTDFPEAATKPDQLATLLDGIRDKVKGRDGKLVGDEKTIQFGADKWPGREFTVDKDKGKQRIKFRVVIRNNRVYQVVAIGTAEFANGKDATAFLESFELTK